LITFDLETGAFISNEVIDLHVHETALRSAFCTRAAVAVRSGVRCDVV
jgi:hypothetical protein